MFWAKLKFILNPLPFRVEFTTHAAERMNERKIDQEMVKSMIRSLGKRRLYDYNNSGFELAIVNHQTNMSVILEVRFNKAVVITVMNRSNIYVKKGTLLEQIA